MQVAQRHAGSVEKVRRSVWYGFGSSSVTRFVVVRCGFDGGLAISPALWRDRRRAPGSTRFRVVPGQLSRTPGAAEVIGD
jgi:hypothetical protein